MSFVEMQLWLDAHSQVRVALVMLATGLVAIFSFVLSRRLVDRGVGALVTRNKATWDDVLHKHGVFEKVSWLAPALVIYLSISLFTTGIESKIAPLLQAYSIVVFMIVTGSLLTAVNDIYSTTKTARDLPIKGYLQVVKLIIYIAGSIVVLALLFKRSPWVFLSGFGAATAVLLLVFKDTILSFVASIQLATNDMIRLGDWIEMPKYDANGEVIDIALHTVKVQNWDLTITTVPTFKLIEDSFKNYRGIEDRGARRIKRAIHLDIASIRFLERPQLERMQKIQLLAPYVRDKQVEIELWNKEQSIDGSSIVNGRRMTNVGTFRAYLYQYLKANPRLRQDMALVVRQLQPGPEGLPIEINVFAAETKWAEFEAIQSDIFDHVLAVLPEFELRAFQNPSGADFAEWRK